MPTRKEVYDALDGERDYQNSKSSHNHTHSVGDWLVFMRTYLTKAEKIRSTDWSDECLLNTLNEVRKVTALGVACMENLGAPKR